MSLKKFIIILLGGLLVACVVFQFFGAPSKKAAVGQSDQMSSRPVFESEEARKKLAEVLDGKRKPPELGSGAWGRYYTLTRKWIGSLSLSDCIALIDSVEGSGRDGSLTDDLYRRYGELDHQGALKRLERIYTDQSLKGSLISYVIRGWSKVQPEEAWNYFTGLDQWEVFRNTSVEWTACDVFEEWVQVNPERAYQALCNSDGNYFHQGSNGYYGGLTASADFPKEASQLEADIIAHKHRSGHFEGWNEEWNDDDLLSAILATKWAGQEADAAMDWWLKIDQKSEGWESKEKWRAYRIGRLVSKWAGEWNPESSDQALRWISAKPDLVQFTEFQDVALPNLARYRPKETLDLIRMIESTDRQALQLALLTRAPVYTGDDYHRQMAPSAILPPDLVEQCLGTFKFNPEQLQSVTDAIRERRDHETKKPVVETSGW